MSELSPIDLRCEHLFAPQGLNTRQPRLTWALSGSGRDRRQTAYRIVAGPDAAAVAAGEGAYWDSGKVASGETLLIPYAGSDLRSDERVYWSVQVWDESDRSSAFCPPASFHTGLLDRGDWSARWVSRALVPPGGRFPPQDTVYDNPYWARPADYYRKEFSVARPLRRATAYVTALGLYELHVNGVVVGDQVLAPGWTDYHTRVEYQTYDVTALLEAGTNAIGAIVGEGWYCGRVAYDQKRAGSHYGVRPVLLCQLNIEYADGSRETVATDATWRCGNEAIVYSDLLLGEKYDARLERPGWDRPGFDDDGWWAAEEIEPLPHAPLVEATRGVPTRRTVTFEPTCLHRTAAGKLIFDLGQNIAGRVRIALNAPSGAEFVLRHGEALQEDGTLYTANLRWALATDTYISRGGPQVFEPRFTVHGFRYVEVTVPEGMTEADIRLTGIAIHSDMPPAGSFACGDDMVNQLVSNIEWTQRGNFLSVPTDCPQRDERMGWLGDAQVFYDTAACNMDTAAFFTKWLVDIADAQTADGFFTDVAPSRVYTRFAPEPPRGAPGWGDAGVIIPWQTYLRYGDADVLRRYYDGMVRWLDVIERNNPDFIRNHAVASNWGDWLCLGNFTPKNVVATAYWAHIVAIMVKVAGLLGRRQDEARFTVLWRNIRSAFQDAFIDGKARVAGDTQTGYLLALAFGLVDDADRGKAVDHLLRTIDEADGYIQTGIHGIRHIGPVLSEEGAGDIAYDLLLKDSYPSWGFSIRNGATTIWERWDGWTPERGFQSVNMNSLNHYALGAVGAWLYSGVAGIDVDEQAPGFRRIRMRPRPSPRLKWCRSTLRSHLGEIASEWKCSADRIEWTVTVPPNCRAVIEPPAAPGTVLLDGAPLSDFGIVPKIAAGGTMSFEIGSGTYPFTLMVTG